MYLNFKCFLISLYLLFPLNALAQQNPLLTPHLSFEPELSYDPAIPSPKTYWGDEWGTTYTVYARIADYVQALAAASDRIQIKEYGQTYEGRRLYRLVISSVANHQQMETLRENNLRLTDPSLPASEAEKLIETLPVFTSFSYNIHGNEGSTTPAALQVAYRLAAATDAATQALLDQSVIILYPCINPDGRDRYVYWYKSVQRQTLGKEPRDLEHYAPWPNGRTNHYWFDLNRDWIWGIHPESRGHTAEYQRWMPQVHVDYHEQGYHNNYFTSPGTTPRNLLLPDQYEALSDTFGRANIAAFDRNQISYATREAFDFFYPGYGSSYPSVMGAIGMLTEQGGIGGGRAVETDDGFVLTLRQRIYDHYTTSMATIRKAAEHRQMLRRYANEAYQPSNSKSKVKAYLFPPQAGTYLLDVLGVLHRQGVQIETSTAEFLAGSNTKSFRDGQAVKGKVFPKGSYIVKTDQSRHLFINSIMQRNLAIEDSVMYDMSSWAAPIAYNLEAYYTESAFSVATQKLSNLPSAAIGVENPEATYAFVTDWQQRNAPKALALLWDKGYRVRSARKAFRKDQTWYSAGSLIVLLGRNREKAAQIRQDFTEIAQEAQVKIHGWNTGRMDEGIDLASRDSRPVKAPRVALMVEPPFSTYTCGQIYFLFDQETHLPIERIRTSILQQTALPKFGARYGYADLNDYDVLILPGGGNGLQQLFDKKYLAVLKDWIGRGGILVATESAASFFTSKRSKLTPVKLLEVKKDSSEVALYLPYGERTDYYGKKRIPGAALNAQLDTSHPLAFGMEKELYTLKFGHLALQPHPDFQTVGHYVKEAEELLVAGYAAEANLQHLAGKSFAGVWPMGKGKVVFLMDNTQYRMFWRGPSRMMQNAVMLLKGM